MCIEAPTRRVLFRPKRILQYAIADEARISDLGTRWRGSVRHGGPDPHAIAGSLLQGRQHETSHYCSMKHPCRRQDHMLSPRGPLSDPIWQAHDYRDPEIRHAFRIGLLGHVWEFPKIGDPNIVP